MGIIAAIKSAHNLMFRHYFVFTKLHKKVAKIRHAESKLNSFTNFFFSPNATLNVKTTASSGVGSLFFFWLL